MFVTYVGLSARLALFTEISFAFKAVEQILRKAILATVLTTSRTVNLLREFDRFFTKVADSALALNQFLIILPFFS